MKPPKKDRFANIVFQALNNARDDGEFGFELYHLMLDGSDTYKPNPTIIISPENNWRKIIAKCSAKTRKVHVSYSQSYYVMATKIVDTMNIIAKRSASEINPVLPYHFNLSEIIL